MFTEPRPMPAAPAEAPVTRKFMFERSFDGSAAHRAPERKPVTLKPDQYDALKQEAYDQGFAMGKKAGIDEQTSQLMALLNAIGVKIDHMAGTMQAIQNNNDAYVRRLAVAMLTKFVPDLTARHGLQEVEAMVAKVVTEMAHEPRLVVRIHESQFDAVDKKIASITEQKAYSGKIVVLADADVAPGDCRIEWADGGIERNAQALQTMLEETVTPESMPSNAT